MASDAENVSIWWRHHVSGCSTGAVVIILFPHWQYNLTDMAKNGQYLSKTNQKPPDISWDSLYNYSGENWVFYETLSAQWLARMYKLNQML